MKKNFSIIFLTLLLLAIFPGVRLSAQCYSRPGHFRSKPRSPDPHVLLRLLNKTGYHLDVNVKNVSSVSASTIKLTVYNPDRNKVIHETELSQSLAPHEETTIPVSFKMPGDVSYKDHGICHVNYELLNENNQSIQPASFSDSGRFTICKVEHTFDPHPTYSLWITSAKDFLLAKSIWKELKERVWNGEGLIYFSD
ncbi:MAG: hypothetical protein GY757_05080, partial [bacterium]|nr:hypothetical protein [bacterium]